MNQSFTPPHAIHVLCCPDSHYCPYTGVMLTSLLENNRRHHIEIWIATTDYDPDNCRRFLTLEDDYDCRIHIIHVTQKEMDALPDVQGLWSKATYLRLTVLKSLPADVTKILYLDGDIIVNTDIAPLWNHHMGDKAAVVVTDINDYLFDNGKRLNISQPYFNAGVMVLDLDRCRQLDLTDRCIQIISTMRLDYLDQDALNMVLDGHVVYASLQWNLVTGYMQTRNYQFIPPEIISMTRNIIHNRRNAIIHYTDFCKPWITGTDTFHPLYSTWHRFYRKSPWKYINICKHIRIPIRQRISITRLKMLRRLGIRSTYNDTFILFD